MSTRVKEKEKGVRNKDQSKKEKVYKVVFYVRMLYILLLAVLFVKS